MKKIIHFLNIAILSFFASCIILLFGGIEYRTADLMQSIAYQETPHQSNEYEDDFNPKSDYYSIPDNVFQEDNNAAVVYL